MKKPFAPEWNRIGKNATKAQSRRTGRVISRSANNEPESRMER
jgi:hypothetical protein